MAFLAINLITIQNTNAQNRDEVSTDKSTVTAKPNNAKGEAEKEEVGKITLKTESAKKAQPAQMVKEDQKAGSKSMINQGNNSLKTESTGNAKAATTYSADEKAVKQAEKKAGKAALKLEGKNAAKAQAEKASETGGKVKLTTDPKNTNLKMKSKEVKTTLEEDKEGSTSTIRNK